MTDGRYLLDTGVVLLLVRGGAVGSMIDKKFGLTTSKVRAMASRVTHAEVRVLAERNRWGPERLEALQNALRSLVTVEIDHPDVLDAYVEIDLYSDRHPDGARNMGKNDVWIAACAKAAHATLITLDRDFSHLHPDQLVVEYVDPNSGP